MMKAPGHNKVGIDGWVFFSCAVLLALGYSSRFMHGAKEASSMIPGMGWTVAVVSLAYGVIYLIGDNKGRNWVGSILPFLFAFCGLRLALW